MADQKDASEARWVVPTVATWENTIPAALEVAITAHTEAILTVVLDSDLHLVDAEDSGLDPEDMEDTEDTEDSEDTEEWEEEEQEEEEDMEDFEDDMKDTEDTGLLDTEE